mgnify:CR=1 FL=1
MNPFNILRIIRQTDAEARAARQDLFRSATNLEQAIDRLDEHKGEPDQPSLIDRLCVTRKLRKRLHS